ncbi:Glucose-6-phosphate isomerase [uncultured archaeon]|nr:Glucose-6-phosphate isomerase [uncultured archaeon]
MKLTLPKVNYKLKNKDYLKKIKSITQKKDYSSNESSSILPYETKYLNESQNLSKKFSNYSTLILVGIGGSNLGVKAIENILIGSKQKQILYADTVDSDNINQILEKAIGELRHGRKVCINGISKSGTTLETMQNLEFLIEKLTEYGLTPEDIILTSDKKTNFHEMALENKCHYLEIPKTVGGRYSVFSNVGLFPLAFKGIDVKKILEGAKKAMELDNEIIDSVSFELACLNKQKDVENIFVFSNSFEDYGKWLKQLTAESLSKKNSKKKIIPMVTIGTTDLHSMSQLFYSHPENFFHCFYEIESNTSSKIGDADLEKTMRNIQTAVQKSFDKKKIPYSTLRISKTPEEIGLLMQFQMIKTMLLAKELGINAFDQPDVEEYKKLIREN